MADSGRDTGDAPRGRTRAPTITIDTTDASPAGRPPAPSQDEGTSSSTLTNPASGSSNTGSEKPRPMLQTEYSFDSKDSRPTSPHNVSSPVTSKAAERGQNFLSVPQNHRSRQNSVDSEDGARSVSSQSETVAAPWQGEKGSQLRDADANEKIINDKDALKPDAGKEADFEVQNNPFAFSPGQLSKMFNPKSLSAFYALGGLAGLEKGLRTDRQSGLSVDEKSLSGSVTFEQATKESSKLANEGIESDAASIPTQRHAASEESFADRKRIHKDNRLPEKKGKSLLQLMWITYNDKVLILLSIAAVVSLAIGLYQTFGQPHTPEKPAVEWVEGVAIIAAILIVVIVGSLNDYSKELQFAKLNKKKKDRDVQVIRSGKTIKISVFDILVGDVMHLNPGDLIPVDGVLIQGYDVKCDESQATGESDVIKKQGAEEVFKAIQNGSETKKLDPFIQSGARVMEGVGTFLVTSTGIYSSYGKTLMALDEDPEITPLQSKLNIIAEYIAKLGGAAGLLLFIVLFIMFLVRLPHQNFLTPAEKGQNFLNIFIVVVTIIVVAVPEGLPLAVTLALAFATRRMLRDNNLVRHLKACEVMGNATTICSDKTGTLTQNVMRIVAGTVGTSHRFGSSTALDSEDSPVIESPANGDLSAPEVIKSLAKPVQNLLLQSIAINSTAFEGEVDGSKTFIGSKTETAMLIFAKEHLALQSVDEERANATIHQLIPFDSGRKCMGVVVALPDGKARLYVKGASEILLDKCAEILRDPTQDLSAVPMTADNRETIQGLIENYASRSLRTISIIYRDFAQWPPKGLRRSEDNPKDVIFEDLSRNMTFIGLVGIQDPLREGVPHAVALCQKAGVVVRMVTGDNKLTAQAIAKECGILQPNGLVMEGPAFRNLSRSQQESIIPRLQVLARSSPEDKRILVRRLKDMGETVAVTGDGTNDAPALKLADVGFSMGIAGTEVAKEASAIILMDDNFNSIVKALKWGRAVNDAVKRFLQFQLTVNITAVLLTFITAVANESESSVLTAVQLLWVNLIMDTLAALALATDPPQDSVLERKPEPRGHGIISTTMWKMIIGQAIYQLTITLLLYWGSYSILSYDEEVELKQIPTLVFNTFVWMQIFNQWNNRRLDNKFNIFEGLTQNWFFIGINTIMCAMQVLIIFFGRQAFNISDTSPPQTGAQWGYAIFLGFLSIPIGMIIRLIPDSLLVALIPEAFKRRHSKVPGLTLEDERFDYYPTPFADVRDELAFLKKIKGGRINNLKFAMKHPREAISRARSPSHSRSNSIRTPQPQTPTRENSFGGSPAPTPDSRKRSRSMRSRSNSALGAPTVMAGIVAGSIAAGWSPVDRIGDRDFSQLPPRPTPSPLSNRGDVGTGVLDQSGLTEEPEEIEPGVLSDVPRLSVPQPPSHKSEQSIS